MRRSSLRSWALNSGGGHLAGGRFKPMPGLICSPPLGRWASRCSRGSEHTVLRAGHQGRAQPVLWSPAATRALSLEHRLLPAHHQGGSQAALTSTKYIKERPRKPDIIQIYPNDNQHQQDISPKMASTTGTTASSLWAAGSARLWRTRRAQEGPLWPQLPSLDTRLQQLGEDVLSPRLSELLEAPP